MISSGRSGEHPFMGSSTLNALRVLRSGLSVPQPSNSLQKPSSFLGTKLQSLKCPLSAARPPISTTHLLFSFSSILRCREPSHLGTLALAIPSLWNPSPTCLHSSPISISFLKCHVSDATSFKAASCQPAEMFSSFHILFSPLLRCRLCDGDRPSALFYQQKFSLVLDVCW